MWYNFTHQKLTAIVATHHLPYASSTPVKLLVVLDTLVNNIYHDGKFSYIVGSLLSNFPNRQKWLKICAYHSYKFYSSQIIVQ